jgi:hypothetical protein
MGLFDLIKPPSIEKMIADNNIEGLVNLLNIPQYRITQEKIERAGQAQVAIRKLANEKNAQYLVQRILDSINKKDNPDFYFRALSLMKMESLAVKPLSARLMTYYYLGGMNVQHPSSVNFDELRKKNRVIYDILIKINDKQIIKPLLLAMADQDYSSYFGNIEPVKKRLILFGNDVKPKLQEIVSAPDSEIYLNTLIEDLFQTYNVIEQIEPIYRVEVIWNKRVEFVVSILCQVDKTYRQAFSSPSPYMTNEQKSRMYMDQMSANRDIIDIKKNPGRSDQGKFLRQFAQELLEKIEKGQET